VVASSVTFEAGIRGGQPTWGGDDRRPSAPSALRTVRVATGNRAVRVTGRLSQVVKMETGR
jgi:hypothetical protein